MKLIDRKKKIRLIIMCIVAVIGVGVVKYLEEGKLDKLDIISLLILSVFATLVLFFIIRKANK